MHIASVNGLSATTNIDPNHYLKLELRPRNSLLVWCLVTFYLFSHKPIQLAHQEEYHQYSRYQMSLTRSEQLSTPNIVAGC